MKIITSILLIFCFGIVSISQDCLKYYPINDNDQFTIENYDKKAKLTGYSEYKVLENLDTKIRYAITTYDRKDEMIGEMEFEILCGNNTMSISMENFVPMSTYQQMESMTVEVTGDYLDYPNQLVPNTKLPDADMKIAVGMSGTNMMVTNIQIYNRKVHEMESVEVPAGTFNCFKISETVTAKVLITKTTAKNVIYLSPEYGFVKSESYNKKGKLLGYSLLAK